MDQVDILIVGAGVVGLAIAAELSRKFKDYSIVVVERHARFGREISSRNSEVIHAGMYYPSASIKARACVEGNKLLYKFCEDWNIPHKRLGKLIVARNQEEIPALESLIAQGVANGILDLQILDHYQMAELEPNVKGVAAILSPSTGIVDSHRFMAQLERLAAAEGAMLAYHHEVLGIEVKGSIYSVYFGGPGGLRDSISCRYLINCAGLAADHIASLAGIDLDLADYRIRPCKGEYFSVSNAKSSLITRLIYPLPLRGLEGLGVHATKTMDGRFRLGPSTLYVDQIEYTVEAAHAQDFYQVARTYLPFIDISDLQPDMAGIRPKLQGHGEPFRDFVICNEIERGLAGIINLIGIESPGLTSCLSLARLVGDMIAS